MSSGKKILLWLTVFLLVLEAFSLPFRDDIISWISILKNGWGNTPYQWAASATDGTVCAARMKEDGVLFLRFFNRLQQTGDDEWQVSLPDNASEREICTLYPVGDQCVYVGFYEDNARYLSLYRLQKEIVPEQLMREQCTGENIIARRASRAFSAVTQERETIIFTLLTENNVRILTTGPDKGLTLREETARNNALAAVALPDSVYVGNSTVAALTFMGNGFYYLDGTNLKLYYGDLSANAHGVELLDLDDIMGKCQLTSLSLQQDGSVLLLLDGHTLWLVQESGVVDLTDRLYLTRAACKGRMIGLLAPIVGLTAILWYLLGASHRNRLPLALNWGLMMLALIILAGVSLRYGLLDPAAKTYYQQQRTEIVSGAVGLNLTNRGIEDEELPYAVCDALEKTDLAFNQGLHVVAVHQEGEGWYLPGGIRSELNPGVHAGLLQNALLGGSASWQDENRYWYCLIRDGNGLIVSTRWDNDAVFTSIRQIVLMCLLGLGIGFLLVLLLIERDVGRITRGLERYAGEQEWKRIRVSSGDELEVIASVLNNLAATRKEEEEKRNRITVSYRRFVPEWILELLGKKSVLDVNKDTLAVREMVVMKVRFTFPTPVYTNTANTRLLFSSVNQVIERSASVVLKKGGAVFNFGCYGYDVVMEKEPRQAISTAVTIQQEILALNEQRIQEGLPAVSLCIAIDVGEVILGIIGDENQIEPTTISASFSTLEELLSICRHTNARILCTEAIISGAEGYGSRYVGHCAVAEDTERVYEIFDGDPYTARKGKEASVQRFTEGVLSLYGGEIARAKRIFLELVRDNPQDGSARFYLYLADRLEEENKDGSTLVLNVRRRDDGDTLQAGKNHGTQSAGAGSADVR